MVRKMGNNIKDDKDLIEAFAKNLDEFIKNNNYTNESFGALLGVGESTVRKYRKGDALPSHPQMKQILQIMGVRYHKVMGFDDPESK